MLETARILAGVVVILLIVATAAWANPLGRPQSRRPDDGAVANAANLQVAAILLLAAVGLGAVAAFLAIVGRFAT